MLSEDIGHVFEMADSHGEHDPARTNTTSASASCGLGILMLASCVPGAADDDRSSTHGQ